MTIENVHAAERALLTCQAALDRLMLKAVEDWPRFGPRAEAAVAKATDELTNARLILESEPRDFPR